MKFTVLVGLLIACLGCFAFGGYMACHEAKGWGWFLISGLILVYFCICIAEEE